MKSLEELAKELEEYNDCMSFKGIEPNDTIVMEVVCDWPTPSLKYLNRKELEEWIEELKAKKVELETEFWEWFESQLPKYFEWVSVEPTKERWSRLVRMLKDLDSKK